MPLIVEHGHSLPLGTLRSQRIQASHSMRSVGRVVYTETVNRVITLGIVLRSGNSNVMHTLVIYDPSQLHLMNESQSDLFSKSSSSQPLLSRYRPNAMEL
ncbi:hypothetical protein BC938DRAFT_472143 [Jimgerdemannia flammicorona]|uniref:Uncharacterized protein n=1 Tax=Jimgerdemannia flammicorona TaxID=994334 RepID=A0A433QU42_9FUNG|nr:hypothetical protein BC938DRAFT_472143 [Jimgerdemannia flammicorona]